MEESVLDFASQASSELQESLALATNDEQKDTLILDHIKKLSSLGSCVLEDEEEAEWVTGFAKNESLAYFCLGRLALMDFFTYCCINCQHILPDLRDLEQMYRGEDGFVVVGVHSAKFETERKLENVSHAAQRLGVSHPILNDPKAKLWNRLGIHCWPTLLLLDPKGKPILVLAGEGHREILFRCVSVALKHFKKADELRSKFVPPIPTLTEPNLKNNLRFPGKIILNPFIRGVMTEPWMTVSDSGNNRILVADSTFEVLHVIGGLEPGNKDGTFREARFNNPQGVCWLDSNTFIVCDTGNHFLRKVNLVSKTVEIFAGTGDQAEFGDQGGLMFCQQSITSPWDIVLYQTPDMDMSVRIPPNKKKDEKHKEKKEKEDKDQLRRVLLIASAGCHQIWALFLDTTIWWKYKSHAEGTLIAIVGSGREENRNNRYPNAAGLAQPSGLCLSQDQLFIADSESSTIRKLDLTSGQLHGLVGGDRNPCNLFAYGDLDGLGYSVRLQHPLGVTCCPKTQKIYIADSYNHKIKYIDPTQTSCSTIYPYSDECEALKEPGGLCVSLRNVMYVADTNNDRIFSINLTDKQTKEIKLRFPECHKKVKPVVNPDSITAEAEMKLCSLKGSQLILNLNCIVSEGKNNLHFTPKATQRWMIKFYHRESKYKSDLINEWNVSWGVREGKELPGKFDGCLKLGYLGKNVERKVCLELFLSLCEGNVCLVKRYFVNIVMLFKAEYDKIAHYNINCTVDDKKQIAVDVVEET